MSCHESPLKQTVAGEEEGREKVEGWRDVYAEDTNTQIGVTVQERESERMGCGGMEMVGDMGGGLQRYCLGENENDGWCGICWKIFVRVCVWCSQRQSRINLPFQQ